MTLLEITKIKAPGTNARPALRSSYVPSQIGWRSSQSSTSAALSFGGKTG